MEYNIEMEEVLELWQNVSKDPEYISKDMGISMDRVHEILGELSDRGDILDYEEKVLSFNEMYMDDETRKRLKLTNIKGHIPLFGEYNSPHFTVLPAAMEREADRVSIHLIVYSPLTDSLTMRLDYMPDEQVYFRPCELDKDDYKDLESLWGYLLATNTKDEFFDLTKKILNDKVPIDYWNTQKNEILN